MKDIKNRFSLFFIFYLLDQSLREYTSYFFISYQTSLKTRWNYPTVYHYVQFNLLKQLPHPFYSLSLLQQLQCFPDETWWTYNHATIGRWSIETGHSLFRATSRQELKSQTQWDRAQPWQARSYEYIAAIRGPGSHTDYHPRPHNRCQPCYKAGCKDQCREALFSFKTWSTKHEHTLSCTECT